MPFYKNIEGRYEVIDIFRSELQNRAPEKLAEFGNWPLRLTVDMGPFVE